jgi:phage terminase large subunit
MEPAFSYMVLGRYPSQSATQLISRDWIAKARSRWDAYVSEKGEIPPKGTPGVTGLDVAEFGADANAACFRCGGWVEQMTTWNGMDTIATGDRASNEYKARPVIRVNVDATGVGTGVAPHMQRNGCSATPIKVASSPTETSELGEFHILRDQLWWACREWLRTDPGAMLPPDELLLEELAIPTYEVRNEKIRVMPKNTMRELLKRSPDRADSLVLTFASGCNLIPEFSKERHTYGY